MFDVHGAVIRKNSVRLTRRANSAAFGLHEAMPRRRLGLLRKSIGERLPVGSRGVARQAIFMVQTAQNRRRDHLRVFRKAMTGGHELIRFGQPMWNARSQAGVWTTSVIVGHPFAKNPSEMCLVNRDQPIETLPTHRADQSLPEPVGMSSRLHRQRAVRHKPSASPIPSIRCVAGRFS